MEMFEKASRLKLRFQINGEISTEQLWSVKESTLIDYEEELQNQVEKFGKTSRRKSEVKTNEQALVELKLAIVSYVLDTKIKEREEAQDEAGKKEHNQKILALITRKQENELESMSVEDLQKLMK
jgi:hypothetical protein